jgi:hypothetical protein
MVERVGLRVNSAGMMSEGGYSRGKREGLDSEDLLELWVEVLRGANNAPLKDDKSLFYSANNYFEPVQPIGDTPRAMRRTKSGLTLVGGSGQMKIPLLQDEREIAENRPALYEYR